MPISTVWILKYVQQCYVKWFWTISSLGAPDDVNVSVICALYTLYQWVENLAGEADRLSKISPNEFASVWTVNWQGQYLGKSRAILNVRDN